MNPQPNSGLVEAGSANPETAAQELVEQARSKRSTEPEVARTLFEQAYMVCPSFPGLCMELGELMAEQNDPQSAVVTLSQVPATKRDVWFYLLVARCYSQQSKYQLALAQLRIAQAIAESTEVLFELGKTLYDMTDYTGAIEHFERYLLSIAANQNPEERQAQTLNYIGACYCHLDEVLTALSYFDQSLDADITLTAMHNKIIAMRRLGGIAAETRLLELEFYAMPGVLEMYGSGLEWGNWQV